MSLSQLSQTELLSQLAGYGCDDPLRPVQVARALGVHKMTVYREIHAGRLRAYWVGSGKGTLRITRADFRAYLHDRGIPAGLAALAG